MRRWGDSSERIAILISQDVKSDQAALGVDQGRSARMSDGNLRHAVPPTAQYYNTLTTPQQNPDFYRLWYI